MEHEQDVFNSVEAERMVIGCFAISPGKCISTAHQFGCTRDWFYHAAMRKLYDAMIKLHKNGVNPDHVTIADELSKSNDSDLVFEMNDCVAQCPSTSFLVNYLNILKDKWAKRSCRTIIRETEEYLPGMTGEEAITKLKFELGNVDIADKTKKTKDKSVDDLIHTFKTTKDIGFVGIPCRWGPLQRMLAGHREGKVIIVAGRPGEGKSCFALNQCIYAAAKKHPVGIVSLEMTQDECIARMAGDLANLSVYKMESGDFDDKEIKLFEKKAKEVSALPIHISDKNMNIEQIISWIRNAKHEHGIKLCMIDYLQIISPNAGKSSRSSRNEEVASWSTAIMNVAKDTGVHVMLLSQLSRMGAMEIPQLHHLRDSGAIEQDAYAVIFIFRDPRTSNEVWHDDVPTVANVAKNRGGPTGAVALRFRKTCQKFIIPVTTPQKPPQVTDKRAQFNSKPKEDRTQSDPF